MAVTPQIATAHEALHAHDHAGCVKTALREAEALCEARGVRLTALRRRVLEMVWQGHRAVKAYDLISQFDADGTTKPPTIYRALDFLQEQGLVHKIQTLNAYVGCGAAATNGVCHFFVCETCGGVSEQTSETLSKTFSREADALGFRVAAQTIEVMGQCARCRD